MSSHMLRRVLVLACASLLSGVGCGGCDGLTHVPNTGNCDWINGTASASDTAAATSNTVVLIDTSASYWPRRGISELQPDGPLAALKPLVENFDQGGTRLVSLGTFDGSATTVSWQLADASLPPATGTTQLIQSEKQQASGCLKRQVQSAAGTAPRIPGTDVMGALGAAGAELGSTPAARSHVVLITDGLSNTGCLNLNNVLQQGETPVSVVNSCAAQSGLSQLAGADVQMIGISFQALYPPMSSSQQSWLQNYWRDLCAALRVRSPQSCVAPQTKNSVRASQVSRPSDPKITFPPVTGHQVVVPAPLLFRFNSAVLTRTAQSYLDILVQEIKASGRPITKVIGHTDRVGSAAFNLSLSRRRARAVQAYLAGRGFSGISATGVGFSQPACPDDFTASGQLNQACMAKDRRVDIILGG